MILDQTIRSARAEKRSGALARWMARGLLTALLASASTLPSFAAGATDGPQAGIVRAQGESGMTQVPIALPPIPYLDSMPWMLWDAGASTLKTDILLVPGVTPPDLLHIPRDRFDIKAAVS